MNEKHHRNSHLAESYTHFPEPLPAICQNKARPTSSVKQDQSTKRASAESCKTIEGRGKIDNGVSLCVHDALVKPSVFPVSASLSSLPSPYGNINNHFHLTVTL